MARPEKRKVLRGGRDVLRITSLEREEGSFRTVERLWAEGIVKRGGDCNAVSGGGEGGGSREGGQADLPLSEVRVSCLPTTHFRQTRPC